METCLEKEPAAEGKAAADARAGRRFLRISVGLAVSAVFLYLSLRKVDLSRVGTEIAQVNKLVLFLSLASQLLGFLCSSCRTSLIYQMPAPLPLPVAFRSVLLAFAVNNVTPMRMGELARANYLARVTGLSRIACLGIGAFERLLDVFVLALIAVPVFSLMAVEIPGRSGLFLFLALPALGIVAAWWISRPGGRAFFRRRVHLLGRRLGAAVDRRLDDFERGLKSLDSPRRVAGVTLASFGFWLMNLTSIKVWMLAFGLDLPWYGPVVVLAYAAFGVAIPSSPGFIGTYHYFVIAALGQLGVAAQTATSFALVGHFMAIVPFMLLSLPILLGEVAGRAGKKVE